jgi:putative hydroxymethylpyrimidine transport system substrate-binding protein
MNGLAMRIGLWSCLLAGFAIASTGCGGESEVGSSVAVHREKTQVPEEDTATRKGETTVPEVFKDRGPLKCPSRSESISVTLDADPNAANVGLMMAARREYFADVGLEVFVAGPKNPARAVKYVALGIDNIGVAQQPQVLLASEEGGVPVVALGSVMAQSNAAMIWLPDSGISNVSDLKGKTIAIPGVPFQERFLEVVLAQAGLTLEDVVVKRANDKTAEALLEGRADAIFGGTWNLDGAMLESRGLEPVIKRARDLGLPEYEELVVIAPARCVKSHPGVMRDFMAAVARGTEAAVKDPVEAANFTAQNYRLEPRFRMKDLRSEFAATIPLLSPNAHMDLAQAGRLADWMYEMGIVKRHPPVRDIFINDFLAKS